MPIDPIVGATTLSIDRSGGTGTRDQGRESGRDRRDKKKAEQTPEQIQIPVEELQEYTEQQVRQAIDTQRVIQLLSHRPTSPFLLVKLLREVQKPGPQSRKDRQQSDTKKVNRTL